MKIRIKFHLKLEVNEPDKNYTGLLVIKRGWFRFPFCFTFLVLNPYDPRDGEIALFKDEQMEHSYSSSVACGTGQINPATGKQTVLFDYTDPEETDKMPITFVATQIISCGIYYSKEEIERMQPQKGQRPVIITHHMWEKDFSEVPELGYKIKQLFRC